MNQHPDASALVASASAMAARSLLPPLALLLIVVFAGSLSPAGALRFDLQSGHTKCISDDIKVGAMAVGKYHVVPPTPPDEGSLSSSSSQPQLPDSHRISLRVTAPYGSSLHYAENVQSGNFAFTASEAGDYLACFWAPDHRPPATVGFEFDWRSGVSARDWGSVAKKGQVNMMELELKKLEDTIKSIHEEMFYLREREEEMQELNRRTNSRMAWLSFLSLAICLSVAGLQLWHLKNFFERKKLL
uniref:GOLD domain-containing protein n=1 Tax=Leersia perrieri TaxID=77586 RepID=A0A0D9VUI4_9ORYZ